MKKIFTGLNALKKDRKLGIAERKGRYDLPLNQSAGTAFLVLLIGLMTFLAMMAITASFGLEGLTARWSSGLENAATIEIPATQKQGKIRTDEEIEDLSTRTVEKIKSMPNVKSYKLLKKSEISDLISPWLGQNSTMDDIPLPGLISLELIQSDKEALALLKTTLSNISSDLRLETHEEWLSEIIKLASALKFAALFVTALIALTTIIAIAGAVRSRMAEHQADIELLHLMGARDIYITRQFQRHASLMALKGSLIGIGIGIVVLLSMLTISGHAAQNLLPDFSLSLLQILILLCLPLFVCAIAATTARYTVLRVLAQMP